MCLLNILMLRDDLNFLSHNDTVVPFLLPYFLPLLLLYSRKKLADASILNLGKSVDLLKIPPEKISAGLIPLFDSFQ